MQAAVLYDTAASNYPLPVFVHLFLCSDLYDHLIANIYYGYLWQYFCLHEVSMQPESALIAVWILQRSVLHGFNYCKYCYFIGGGGGYEYNRCSQCLYYAVHSFHLTLSIHLASHMFSSG